MKAKVTRILMYTGIPAHLKGFAYLRESVLMADGCCDLGFAVTADVYPAVAHMFGTTPAAVERNIRTAVDAAWQNGDAALFDKFFGHNMPAVRKKPTNAEFIFTIAHGITAGIFDDI